LRFVVLRYAELRHASTMNITVKSHVMVSEANYLADCAMHGAASAWPGTPTYAMHQR
jgi:hypothetical protein